MDGLLLGIGLVLLLATLAARPHRPDPVVIYVESAPAASGGGCLGPIILAIVVGVLLLAVR